MDRTTRLRLAVGLPDRPRALEARGMLLSGRGRIVAQGEGSSGYALFDDSVTSLLAVVGRPEPASLREALERLRPGSVLVQEEDDPHLAPLLAGFRRQTAVLHLPGPGVALRPLENDPPCRLLGAEPSAAWLEDWPVAQRRELSAALALGLPMAGCVCDDRIAAVCYSCYETETLWDVSIDTLAPHRRRGLASAAVRFLAAHQSARGLTPVWGAVQSNPASLALAARLGFTPVERFVVYEALGGGAESGG
ncbi:MAG: GNAT family N-acetyltransferase [Thermoanaerobaculia bacterium]